MTRVICVCGARPNFMKFAPIMRAFNEHGGFETLLVTTAAERIAGILSTQ